VSAQDLLLWSGLGNGAGIARTCSRANWCRPELLDRTRHVRSGGYHDPVCPLALSDAVPANRRDTDFGPRTCNFGCWPMCPCWKAQRTRMAAVLSSASAIRRCFPQRPMSRSSGDQPPPHVAEWPRVVSRRLRSTIGKRTYCGISTERNRLLESAVQRPGLSALSRHDFEGRAHLWANLRRTNRFALPISRKPSVSVPVAELLGLTPRRIGPPRGSGERRA
jgi:hypothetical protein